MTSVLFTLGRCEHVSFHLCLRAHGLRLGLAPYLVQSCGDGAPREIVGPPRVRTRVLASGEVRHTAVPVVAQVAAP